MAQERSIPSRYWCASSLRASLQKAQQRGWSHRVCASLPISGKHRPHGRGAASSERPREARRIAEIVAGAHGKQALLLLVWQWLALDERAEFLQREFPAPGELLETLIPFLDAMHPQDALHRLGQHLGMSVELRKEEPDRKSTRLNSSHSSLSYA